MLRGRRPVLSMGRSKDGEGLTRMLQKDEENGGNRRRNLRNILKSRVCMVGDMKTDGAVCVGLSVRMVMKRKSHNGERKTNEQKQGNVSIGQPGGRFRGLRQIGAFPQS